MATTNGRLARFVVLEHHWQGVHWDLMLEAGPALRTWALECLPEPGIEIEARALPDHRLAYLDYEGPISGDRGRVRRVEAGTFEPVVWGPDRVVVRLRGVQVIGVAELVRLGGGDRYGWRLRIGKFI
jgi:hypothetical protein